VADRGAHHRPLGHGAARATAVPDLSPVRVRHARRRLTGRDPNEAHRPATQLELLFDLTIVVAIGTAADQLAEHVAEGHVRAGVLGFAFAAFAVTWAWSNYSWFASAYDTDDWVFRLATMVQMVGVVVLALGLEQMFASIDHGDTLDLGVMVAGYVVMRVSMFFLWTQAGRHDPARRPAARTYLWTIAIAQAGWVALVLVSVSVTWSFVIAAALLFVELTGPAIAERRHGGTPWHADHMAERYGLLVIITLGEGVIGTVAALNAVVHGEEGWTLDAVLVAVAGVGLTFGSWWAYFALPWANALRAPRPRAFTWRYGHILIFAGLAAMGSGLHVAALFLEHETEVGAVATVASVVVPVTVFIGALYATYSAVMREADSFHIMLLALTAVVLAGALLLAAIGVAMPICLVVLMLAPVVTVVGYELVGHRHVSEAIDRLGR
jgi:low temperature requirement protein LtrA